VQPWSPLPDPSPTISQIRTQDQLHPVQVDLGTPDGPARLIDEAVAGYGGLDVLVNNVSAPVTSQAQISSSTAGSSPPCEPKPLTAKGALTFWESAFLPRANWSITLTGRGKYQEGDPN
jgi:NAD(P)-dependent dehydrogenase (short-subunit alcohol dehydrogenase family)